MSRMVLTPLRCVIRAAVALTTPILLAASPAAGAEGVLSRAELATLAEHAALAGAGELATRPQATEADVVRAAAAANAVVAPHPDVDAQTAAAIDAKTVTVTLTARGPGRYGIGSGAQPMQVSATAHYLAPQQTAAWAWASRPRLALSAQTRWRLAQQDLDR